MSSDKKNMFNSLNTFTSDADGLSMVDLLTILIVAFTIIWKVAHVICIVKYAETSPQIISQLQVFGNGIDSFFNIIVSFYFVKKGVDTTVSKVVLKDKYKEIYNDVTTLPSDDTFDSTTHNTYIEP